MSQYSSESQPASPSSWRSTLPIHPAAELFPLMSPDELKALGEDIKKNGLTSPVVLWRANSPVQLLLDGRNRLDAIEMMTLPLNVALAVTCDARLDGAIYPPERDRISPRRSFTPVLRQSPKARTECR
jgi:hypothetical protein